MAAPVSREDAGDLLTTRVEGKYPHQVSVTEEEARVLKEILWRDQTAWYTHGGLAGLLTLTPEQVALFRAFVAKVALG